MANPARKRGGKPVAPEKKTPWPLIIGAAGLLLVLLGVVLLRPAPRSSDTVPAAAGGAGPRLTVDQEKIDFGKTKFNTPVKATFRLSNTGDEPLQLIGEPVVAVLQGC